MPSGAAHCVEWGHLDDVRPRGREAPCSLAHVPRPSSYTPPLAGLMLPSAAPGRGQSHSWGQTSPLLSQTQRGALCDPSPIGSSQHVPQAGLGIRKKTRADCGVCSMAESSPFLSSCTGLPAQCDLLVKANLTSNLAAFKRSGAGYWAGRAPKPGIVRPTWDWALVGPPPVGPFSPIPPRGTVAGHRGGPSQHHHISFLR